MTSGVTEIPGLPPALRTVPTTLDGWVKWRQDVRAYRTAIHAVCARDAGARREVSNLCAEDPVYWLTVFGVFHEPRRDAYRSSGWHPFIPFARQVDLIRWIFHVTSIDESTNPELAMLGRGDGVMEKSRTWGATWTFLAAAAHQWLWSDDFLCGLISYKEEKVEKKNRTDTLFYKLEAMLGLQGRVPKADPTDGCPLRLPNWMVPSGYDERQHNLDLSLTHPERTNQIFGQASTGRAGVSDRAAWFINDECAKWDGFSDAYSGQSAVTDHRLCLSSADSRYGMGFHQLARVAEAASKNPESPGPSFFDANYWDNPEHTEAWLERQRARHADDPDGFEREYLKNYRAGAGGYIYNRDGKLDHVEPVPLDFIPGLPTHVWIDPGIRDRTAFHVLQYDAREDQWNLLDTYWNAGKSAGFYASLLVGVPVTGMAGYEYGDAEYEVMDLMRRAVRGELKLIGDPFGDHRGTDGKSTFYRELSRQAQSITEGQIALPVQTCFADRALDPRHDALRKLLPKLRFNDTPRVRFTLEGLKNHKYKDYGGRAVTNPSATPERHEAHDAVTALEWGAIRVDKGKAVAAATATRDKPVRTTISGRPIPARVA